MKYEIDVTARAEQAKAYFLDGYNCSQSVFMAYADLFDLDVELASKLASSFGGGMGRLREVCGTCTGMFMVAGLLRGYSDTNDKEAKDNHYKLIQELANEFKSVFSSVLNTKPCFYSFDKFIILEIFIVFIIKIFFFFKN